MQNQKNGVENIELRSDEFQEILGIIPSWILRWGITILTIIVFFILIGSAIFKYPDVISTTMTLTGSTPTSEVVARNSAIIKELFVKDEQSVKKGDYLAVIDNPANTQDILVLKQFVEGLNISFDTVIHLPPKLLNIGTLQPLYSSFYITLNDYNEFIRLGYYIHKIDFMKGRIQHYTNYYKNVEGQRKLVEMQMALNESQFIRDSKLHNKGIISTEELEKTNNQYIQSQLATENIQSSIQTTEIQINQLKESLLDAEYQYSDKKKQLEAQLKTYASQLLAGIQSWELNYALISPINGKITFTNYWAENQNINTGETVFNIVPFNVDHIKGIAEMPISRSGKVKPGQKVNIKFINFPDNEYGFVKGIVNTISKVPVKGEGNFMYYTVEVSMPNGLYTTYNRELPYMMDMQAQADIITENRSILQRFFLPLKKIWTEGLSD